MQFVIGVIDKQTKWLDVVERDNAPWVHASDGVSFSNSLIQGGLDDTANDPYLTADSMVRILSVDEFKSLAGDDEFYRFTFVNHHEADEDAYHSTIIKDPDGGEHDRTAFRYQAGYTGRPNLDIANAYGCTDGVWMRALLHPSEERTDFAFIVAMSAMGWGNRSDVKVRVRDVMDATDGVRGYNLIGGFNRAYHWFLQTGMGLREHWISNGAPVVHGQIDVFAQVMADREAVGDE